jgi:hypothetical protein
MRRFSSNWCAIAIASLCCIPSGRAQNAAGQSSPEAAVAGQDGCEFYVALQSLEPAAVKLLATPLAPVNRTLFTDNSIRQLQDWDLPSKVTAWRDRPGAEELARQWDELNKQWSAGSGNKDKSKSSVPQGRPAPYRAGPLPEKDWQDLEKWLGKNGPKKLPGLCIDSAKATYMLAVGIITGGAGSTAADYNRVGEYTDYASKPQADSLGPNAGAVAPFKTPQDEFTGAGISGVKGGNTCVYLYRTNGKAIGAGGAREVAPEYYYCHAGGGISQSTVTTMLKYLSKTGLK